jgi:putative endonuclease
MENIAQDYLQNQGLKFIESNFHCRYGELDLIMQDGEWLVFVEVKSVQEGSEVAISETITQEKLKKLNKAIHYWLTKHKAHAQNWRLDFLGILASGDNAHQIYHFPNI